MALAIAWTAVSVQHCLVYPIPESKLRVDEFPIPSHWPHAAAIDIRWDSVAAIWGTRDPKFDIVYLYSEYCGDSDPATNAAALRARGEWIPILVDLAANGWSQLDGQRLIQLYRHHGISLLSAEYALESGILNVRQRMQSGGLKVFPSLRKYLEERRFYHRTEQGQIVKKHDALQDAVRFLVSGISRFRTKPQPPPTFTRPFPDYHGPHAWMAN